MRRVAMVDGALVADGAAAISPFDRGLLYGEGVFETLRTYGRRVFAWHDHAARLARSAAFARVPLPCSLATLAAETSLALGAFDGDEAIVRVVLTAGDGTTSTRVILVEPLRTPPAAQYEVGFVVVFGRAPLAGIARAKTTSYLANVLARADANALGADEMLLIDERGDVLEGATSNVFVVTGETLRTPALDGRLLDGVTRAHVIACASELGLAVEQAPIPSASLVRADEAFLTSTLREVAPITRVDGVVVRGPGPITARLRRAFRERAEAHRAPW